MSHAKLVRDGIPSIIRSAGSTPIVRTADRDEYWQLLRAKLTEEVNEFLASEEVDELADILEVLLAIAAELNLDAVGLEMLRVAKLQSRGGFVDRVVWLGNTPAAG